MARYSLKIKPYPLKWAPGRYWGCFRCLSESLVDRNCGAILLILALKGSFLAPKPHMWRYSEKSCAILTHLANHLNSLKPNFQQIRAGRGRAARDGAERLGTGQISSGRSRAARGGAGSMRSSSGWSGSSQLGSAQLNSARLNSAQLSSEHKRAGQKVSRHIFTFWRQKMPHGAKN
jgi:hypothetical protein